jgi:hypothetical protein
MTEAFVVFCSQMLEGYLKFSHGGFLRVYYCAGDKIEKNEMGGACSSNGERHVQDFGRET